MGYIQKCGFLFDIKMFTESKFSFETEYIFCVTPWYDQRKGTPGGTPTDDYAKDGGPGEVWLLCKTIFLLFEDNGLYPKEVISYLT